MGASDHGLVIVAFAATAAAAVAAFVLKVWLEQEGCGSGQAAAVQCAAAVSVALTPLLAVAALMSACDH